MLFFYTGPKGLSQPYMITYNLQVILVYFVWGDTENWFKTLSQLPGLGLSTEKKRRITAEYPQHFVKKG